LRLLFILVIIKVFSINGLYPIAKIHRSKYIQHQLSDHNELIYILQSKDNMKLHLFLLIEEKTEKDEPVKKYKNQDLAMVTLDTSVLSIFKKEIAIIGH